MSHAFEQINAARIGVICQSTSTKLPLVACMVTLFLHVPTHPIALAVTIHIHMLWKGFRNAPFLFFSMATSLVLFVFGHGVETSHLGDVSAQELCQASEDFSLELHPAHMTVTHLMST